MRTYQWPRLNRFKEHTIELPVATISVQKDNADSLERNVIKALDLGKGLVHVMDAEAKKPKVQVFSIKRACPSCGTSFAELDPRLFSFNSKHGWCEDCFGTGVQLEDFDEEQSGEESAWAEADGRWHLVCETCDGQRLNPIALHVKFRDRNIADLTRRAIDDTVGFISKLKLTKREGEIARDLMAEIKSRLAFLQRVGLGYLPLDRSAPTLSGGEAQRIRLAAQLGSNLQGVCYVLDEPTIGLHPRDNRVLLDALAELAKNRNTLVVVEHDEDTIRRADHVVDLGPGAGVRGGQVVAAGNVRQLMKNPASITGRFLANPLGHSGEPRRETNARAPQLGLEDIELHNVSKEDVSIPVGTAVRGHRGLGLRQEHRRARRALYEPEAARQVGRQEGAPANYPNSRASPPCAASSSSTACSKSTRRRSARRRAPARPPTSASGTTSARSSPTPPSRRSPATRPAASASTRPAAAAKPATARACRPSR